MIIPTIAKGNIFLQHKRTLSRSNIKEQKNTIKITKLQLNVLNGIKREIIRRHYYLSYLFKSF